MPTSSVQYWWMRYLVTHSSCIVYESKHGVCLSIGVQRLAIRVQLVAAVWVLRPCAGVGPWSCGGAVDPGLAALARTTQADRGCCSGTASDSQLRCPVMAPPGAAIRSPPSPASLSSPKQQHPPTEPRHPTHPKSWALPVGNTNTQHASQIIYPHLTRTRLPP